MATPIADPVVAVRFGRYCWLFSSLSMLDVILTATLTLLQARCAPDVSELGLTVAAARLRAAVAQGCGEAAVADLYVTGLMAAEEAWRQGGTDASLTPVRLAATALAMRAATSDPAQVAHLVLLAAAAAAQDERAEMALYLAQATQIERLLLAAGQTGAPYLTALEAAGDLWMRVAHYADAQDAYVLAAQQIGSTPRIIAGIARAARRLRETAPPAVP